MDERTAMMSAKTKLEISQVKALKRILFSLCESLRAKPITNQELASISTNISLIDLKVFQHVATVMYPNFSVSADFLKTLFSNVRIGVDHSVKDLSWNDYMAVRVSHIVQQQPYFRSGSLITQVPPLYENNYDQFKKAIPAENSQQIIDTKQSFPDYIFRDGSWIRYYDLKTGKIKAVKGHIYVTSDMQKYNTISEAILNGQKNRFKHIGDKLFFKKVSSLLEDNTLSWMERNIQMQEFYELHRKDLPSNINPSFIYHVLPEYNLREENFPKNYNRYSAKTSSLSGLEETQTTLIENIVNQGKIIRTNYMESEGASKVIIEEIQNIIKKK